MSDLENAQKDLLAKNHCWKDLWKKGKRHGNTFLKIVYLSFIFYFFLSAMESILSTTHHDTKKFRDFLDSFWLTLIIFFTCLPVLWLLIQFIKITTFSDRIKTYTILVLIPAGMLSYGAWVFNVPLIVIGATLVCLYVLMILWATWCSSNYELVPSSMCCWVIFLSIGVALGVGLMCGILPAEVEYHDHFKRNVIGNCTYGPLIESPKFGFRYESYFTCDQKHGMCRYQQCSDLLNNMSLVCDAQHFGDRELVDCPGLSSPVTEECCLAARVKDCCQNVKIQDCCANPVDTCYHGRCTPKCPDQVYHDSNRTVFYGYSYDFFYRTYFRSPIHKYEFTTHESCGFRKINCVRHWRNGIRENRAQPCWRRTRWDGEYSRKVEYNMDLYPSPRKSLGEIKNYKIAGIFFIFFTFAIHICIFFGKQFNE